MSLEEQVKTLITRRGIAKSQLTRFITYINKPENQAKIWEISSRLDKAKLLLDEFNSVQDEIEIIDNTDVQINERIEFEDRYFEIMAKANNIMHQHEELKANANANNIQVSPAPLTISSVPIIKNSIQLPPINIPKFDGSFDKYTSFRDIFVSVIHENEHLSNVEKFYHLKSHLEGPAAQAIDSLVINDANYIIAYNILNERFENKKFIIKSHVKQIFELPNITKDSYTSIRNFLDDVNKHIMALQNLGEPVDDWSTILIYLLFSKLDISSKRDWEIKTKDIVSPSIREFVQFLKDRCSLLSAIDTKGTAPISKPNDRSNFKSHAHVVSNKSGCIFCKGQHSIYFCKDFLKLSVSARLSEIRKLNACTNCLRAGHGPNECQLGPCRQCKKKHNSLLHFTKQESKQDSNSHNSVRNDKSQENSNSNLNTSSETNSNQNSNSVSNINDVNLQISTKFECENSSNQTNQNDSRQNRISQHTEASTVTHCFNGTFTILSTAMVYIYDKHNQPVLCRALLDSGSQSNFLTKDLQNKLQLHTHKINMPIVGITSAVTNISESVKTKIKSSVYNNEFHLPFLVIDRITENIPQITFDTSMLQISQDIILADPHFNRSSEIQILLGANIFYHLLLKDQIRLGLNEPILQHTKLGWVVSGPYQINNKQQKSLCNFSQDIGLEKQLELFWQLEECPIKQTIFSKEEQECELHFQNTFKRQDSGEFLVKLPFRDNSEQLGETKQMAIQRFQTLERKLTKNQEIQDSYCQFMDDYIRLGHMSSINAYDQTNTPNYYLPHHCVFKDSSLTTKLRVVFDASARSTTNVSLNDVLRVGPCIQDSVFNILLRFRCHSIVFTADIAKMYRCIQVYNEDREYQRIVWRSKPTEPLMHYKLNTVTYGTAPASFLATRCLKQLSLDNTITFPNASKSIANNFYMDDWLDGANDIQSATTLAREVSSILSSAGFNLRQWSSNDKQFLENLLGSERLQNSKQDSQYVVKDSNNAKTLGIFWNSFEDTFQYTTNPNKYEIVTKRIILSIVSQIFDPLGLIGPVIITAKIFLQRLWLLRLGWDEPIPEDLCDIWLRFFHKINTLNDIRIPRQILIENPIRIEVHCFSDASQLAFGTCIYLKSVNNQGQVLVRLICAKSRVAPLKTETLPRLELCGALLSTKLCQTVVDALKLKIDDIYFWCDSTVVLAWIATEPSKLKTFVSNRVSQIQKFSKNSKWEHVPTKSNPADVISRGLNPDEIQNLTLWFNGPSWLSLEQQFWPSHAIEVNNIDIPELRPNQPESLMLTCIEVENELISRFSSLTRLFRVVAYMLRFRKNATNKPECRITGPLNSQELNYSQQVIILMIQVQAFPNELACLRKSKAIPRSSKLLSLDPYLDNFGIIRVGGRLKNAQLDHDHKHPIIIPAKHHFTTLVVRHEHLKNLHAGPQAVLSNIRTQYWPLHGRQVVRSILRKCVVCFRANPQNMTQKMAHLPKQRVNPSPPFFICGVDYAGPYLIKDSSLRNRKYIKAYVCVFVCFSTKSVHLELVSELSTNGFLNMFKRFVARRGLCSEIHSDNATNFVGASNTLSEVANLVQDPKFQNFLLENKITWYFIPARSPHHGGLWESAVRLMKYHLKRVLTNVHLTYEDFYTLLTQVESILNSRPLTPLTGSPEDLDVLTPGHFLIGRSLLTFPEAPAPDTRHTHISRYRHLKFLMQQFWSKWSRDYLHSLQERSRWKTESNNNLSVGSLVVLKEDHTTPMCWKMGRVTKLFPGDDGLTRVALVRTVDGVFKRAITKFCVLPVDTQANH